MSTPNTGALALPTQRPFPIQHLPLDILTEIFTHCLPGQFGDTTILPLRAPLLLCNVCSAWRNIAISTPELWRVFNLHFHRHLPSTKYLVALIHIWLGRAGVLPLAIKFGLSRDFNLPIRVYYSQVDKLRPIYNVLSKYASRWESIEISLPESMFGSLPQPNSVPLLRCLSIGSGFYHGCRVPFGSAPRLTTLVISALHCNLSKVPTIPWHQLTALRISGGTTFPIALDLFKYCPRLENLTILGVDGMDTWPHQPRIEHGTLQDVSLQWTTDCRPLLDSLSLPALKRLSLRYGIGRSGNVTSGSYSSELIKLFNQSNCELEALSVTNSGFTPDGFRECLGHKSCKTLTRLCVTNDYGREMVNDELLVRLTYYEGETEGPLCPNLEQLTFKSCCTKRTSPGLLGGMALSRCVGRAGVKQLQTLNFTAYFPLPVEDVELLKCAVLNGLWFHL